MAPYPGPKGQEIYETVSQQAWQEWQAQQTMLINEKQLSLMDPESRKYLQQEMEKFLNNEQHDKTGYVPTEENRQPNLTQNIKTIKHSALEIWPR